MRRFAPLVFTLLSGCAGISSALEYTDVDVQRAESADYNWRIFDKPTEGRMMITPTFGVAATTGFLSGLTLGAADTDLPKSQYQAGVEAWLEKTGRKCAVTDGYKLIRPQWEFKYTCQTQEIRLEVIPATAVCNAAQEGKEVARYDPRAMAILVPAARGDLFVTCVAPNYKNKFTRVPAGALNKYPGNLTIVLERDQAG
jgi:hypothetical protein